MAGWAAACRNSARAGPWRGPWPLARSTALVGAPCCPCRFRAPSNGQVGGGSSSVSVTCEESRAGMIHVDRADVYTSGKLCLFFFANYISTDAEDQHTRTLTYANPIFMSTSERLCRHILRLTKSPQTSRCRRKRRLPLKAKRY
jgi:hypothetical protein